MATHRLTPKRARNNEGINPLRGSAPNAAALHRTVRCMMEEGQSPRDSRLPIGGNHGATQVREVVVRAVQMCRPPSVCLLNLGRSTRFGAWKVMFVSEVRDKPTGQRDCHIPQLFAELNPLGVLRHCQKCRNTLPGSGWGSGGGYTYYLFGRIKGILKEIAD